MLLKRHRYNDISTIPTNKTTIELSLSPNDNYLIQIKACSDGGEGVGSEPIHIHKLSEFSPVVLDSECSLFGSGWSLSEDLIIRKHI